ncbi:MAG: hypothetical protein WCW47_03720 [Candidatus Paceibacterota bacterium]|jgi:hypothetical protein
MKYKFFRTLSLVIISLLIAQFFFSVKNVVLAQRDPGMCAISYNTTFGFDYAPCNTQQGGGPAFRDNATVTFIRVLPSTLVSGQEYSFKTSVQNIGNTYWWNGDYFKLLQKSGLFLSPSYGHIPTVMDPGGSFETDFILTAPNEPGNYTLELQMDHAGSYFGQTGTVSFNVKEETKIPICSIIDFSAGNITPEYNTSTTLRFSLKDSVSGQTNISFPWSISLLAGGISPSPSSGIGFYGTPTTGNLTSLHTYRLTCDTATRDITIIPKLQSCGLAGGNTCDQPGQSACAGYTTIPSSDCSAVGQKCCYIPPASGFVNLNFIIKNQLDTAVSGASVNIGQDFGNGTTRTTDGGGFANFGVYKNTAIDYSISASGCSSVNGTVNSGSDGTTVKKTLICQGTPPPTSPPPTPTGFWVGPSACDNRWLNLSWNASTGATNYKVYRGGTLVYNNNGLAFSDTGLTLGKTYSYTLTASNNVGTSAPASASGTVSETCPPNTKINGKCSNPPAHYICVAGTSNNKVNGTTAYTWRCIGSGTGHTNDSCLEPKTQSCEPNGSCSAPTPACGQTTTGVDNCNNICSRTGPPCSTTGSCGSRNTTYPTGITSYPGGSTYCSRGNPTSSPAFPSPGGSVSWYCIDAGGSSGQCTASAEIQTYTVTATHSLGGQVYSVDNKINCGGTCSSNYNKGSVVILRAIPSSTYWQFSSWTGDCSGFTTSSCTLNVNSPKNATAVFIPRKFKYIEF